LGITAAARALPVRTRSVASPSPTSRKSKVASARIEATMAFDTALPSRSTTATGMREGFFGGPPSTAPKKAAMRIGAARVTMSARRLEK
jgi:hypothetical protein